MKKVIVIFISAICVLTCFSPTVSVLAYTPTYLRVITDDTPFYKEEDGKQLLFYLPYTYYVKVLDYGDQFVHVEIAGQNNLPALDGYVPKDMLFLDELAVFSPYPVITLTTSADSVFYKDCQLKEIHQYLFNERSLYYYGKIENEKGILYYVGYNEKLGYVKESDVFPFLIPNHPNELTFIKDTTATILPDATSDNGAQTLDTLKIVIIVCLLLAGVTALFIAFRKKDKHTAVTYYDDNDYE